MVVLFGVIGSAALALCGVPQAVMSWRDGHSRGVSWGMIGLWGTGTVLMLVYVAALYADPWMLANYAINACVIGVLAWFKARPRVAR